MVEEPPVLIAGTELAERDWVAARIAELGRSWAGDDVRVVGTVWWYMASSTLLGPPLRMLVETGEASDLALSTLTCTVRPDGGLASVHFEDRLRGAVVGGPEEFAASFRTTVRAIVDTVADVSAAGAPALWAVAADALGNCALDADRVAGPALAVRIAQSVGDVMPTPRFVDVDGRTFVRRASCCLIYETAGAGKCMSCPRRLPDERAGLLTEFVRRGR